MRKPSMVLVALAAICVPAAAQPPMRMHGHGPHAGEAHGRGMQVSRVRHHYVMQHGVPAAYADKQRPGRPSAADRDAGRVLYDANCASCHGTSGRGDGEAGRQLEPPPADLTMSMQTHVATDSYLYWTIAEGGAPVGSAMPPFKTVLSEQQVWQLIAHLRDL